MNMRHIFALGFILTGSLASQAWAVCEVHTSDRTYADGTVLNGTVCDSAGALKISGDLGNVTVNGADGAITDGATPTIKATVKNYTNSKPLTTIIVDTNGDPASVGGGTEVTEDAAAAANPTGKMDMCRRRDTLTAAEVSADSDVIAKNCTAKGEVYVKQTDPVTVTDGAGALNVIVDSGTTAATQSGTWTMQPGNTANTTPWVMSIQQGGNTAAVNASSQLSVNCANCSGSGVSQQDNTGFTPGTTNFVPMGGEVDDTGTTAVTENNAGVARITAQRAVHMNLRNNSGTEIGTSGNPVRTDPTGTTTQPVSGTVSITANSSVNVAQMNGVTTSMGVGASGTGTQRVASIIHDGTDTAQVTATSGGSLQVECTAGCSGSGGTSSNYGSAFPSAGTAAGFTDGTNMVAGRVVTSAPSSGDAGLVVRPISPASSTPGSAVPSSGVQITGTDGTNARVLATDSSGNAQVNVKQINGVAPTMGNGASGTGVQRVTIASDSTGQVALAAGSNTVGNVGVVPVTSGGTSVCYLTSAASTNATNCKASAGQLYGFDLINTTTTIYYLRLYNLSSAPTCSSSTGFIRTIPVPPAAAAGGAGGITRSMAMGEAYGTGLGFCLTGGGSSTDNTNAATGVYVSLNYK